MAYIGPTGSTVAFQGTVPWSVLGNNSVSGTVNVGNFPGSVVSFQGGAPWVHTNVGSIITVNQGSIAAVIIGGSIAASFTPPANQSVSGTVTVGSLLSMQGYVSPGNTISSQLSSGSVFTGAWEEVKDFSAIYITVNADTASATDGLALQRSTNASSVITSDVYTIPAQTGKTFQIQPDARYFRVQYTNSAANQAAMALQTVYKQSYSKPSSQRPSDGYTNETDLEQMQGFNMVYNGTTWDRMRGTTSGALVTGSVQQGTNPWNIAGSVAAFQAGTNITSVSGNLTISSASIAGQVTVVSSLAGGIFPISGSVAAVVTNTPNVNTAGSVVAFQGTSPWIVNFQNSSILAIPTGSVITILQTSSLFAVQQGVNIASVVSSNPSSLLTGNYAQRNDNTSSFLGGNLTWNPLSTDSAGRSIVKPFSSEDGAIISYVGSIVSGSVQLIQASVIGKRNYITDFWLSNTGTATTLVTFQGGDTSLIGKFIAPTNGGMSSPGIAIPLKTTPSQDLAFKVDTATSVLYVTLKGYQAP